LKSIVPLTGIFSDFDETIWAGASLLDRVAKDRWMMRVDSWCATALDGRTVKYAYKELSDGIAAISATIEGWSVMMFQKGVRAPLTRRQVEALFEEKFEVGDLTVERQHSRASLGV
jgi:hypothetical protein